MQRGDYEPAPEKLIVSLSIVRRFVNLGKEGWGIMPYTLLGVQIDCTPDHKPTICAYTSNIRILIILRNETNFYYANMITITCVIKIGRF
jgi:hypothetical protein